MKMTLPADSLIAYTLEKMNVRLIKKPFCEDGRVRNGLLFTGNVHDAIPRRLLLDTRLSPIDKIGWMIIRLHAQNNEGAVFPSYDELQLQLTSSGKGRASRETVSRVLLMLRITGWLSLCKRVRDDKGRVRGNIYAQHDEPLTFRDAELFDPRFLDTVVNACMSKNRTISQTARELLEEIKVDPTMRHYHSHLSMLETRLGGPQDARQMAIRQQAVLVQQSSEPQRQSSESELCKNGTKNHQNKLSSDYKKLSSESELSKNDTGIKPSSDSELPVKSGDHNRVRNQNCYVRNITHSVKKNTYVLPEKLTSIISSEDQIMLTEQLQALPEDQARQICLNLQTMLAKKQLYNPTGWLLIMMKKAREGILNLKPVKPVKNKNQAITPESLTPTEQPVSEEQVHSYVRELLARLRQTTSGNSV